MRVGFVFNHLRSNTRKISNIQTDNLYLALALLLKNLLLTDVRKQSYDCQYLMMIRKCTYFSLFHLIYLINSSPPGQHGRHFADNIFRSIFANEKHSILIKICLKFIPKGPLNNTSGNGAEQATSVSWTNADRAHWRLYATVPHN